MAKVVWKSSPDEHDFPAAGAYLSLLADEARVAQLIQGLRSEAVVTQKAKDILRASRLPLLEADNVHVAADLVKIVKKKPLSPILLVRGDIEVGRALQIADGYHRVCASYHTDENTDIPCRIADLPSDSK